MYELVKKGEYYNNGKLVTDEYEIEMLDNLYDNFDKIYNDEEKEAEFI